MKQFLTGFLCGAVVALLVAAGGALVRNGVSGSVHEQGSVLVDGICSGRA